MFIKIYFGDKPVFLCDLLDNIINEYLDHPGTIYIKNISEDAVKSLLAEVDKPTFYSGILYDKDFNNLKNIFYREFTTVQTGGGLVFNNKKEVLMIFRRGKWDLPKGKLDKGETLEECALREVEEETGLKDIELGKKTTITYHTYKESGKFILKESHWYKMKFTGDKKPVPQTEEDITEIKWVKQSELGEYTVNTFKTIIEVLGYLKME